jgi:Ca-activated chloride channel family protein
LIFANPLWLTALLALPLIYYYGRKRESRFAVYYPQVKAQKAKFSSFRLLLFVLSLALGILALARPQTINQESVRQNEGIDMMLAIDTSGSMKEADFTWEGQRYSRLTVVKAVISDFILKRKDDRIGIVVFGAVAFAQAPLTLDHDVLNQFVDVIQPGMAGQETAIGDGLGVAISRMKDRPGKTKVVILLTDGINNSGRLDPMSVVEAAKQLKVKVYTIGVAGDGSPAIDLFGFKVGGSSDPVDSKLLQAIATETGGKYFRAKNTKSLIEIYSEIDTLEKSKIEEKVFKNVDEKYKIFLGPAALLLILQFLLGFTPYRKFV